MPSSVKTLLKKDPIISWRIPDIVNEIKSGYVAIGRRNTMFTLKVNTDNSDKEEIKRQKRGIVAIMAQIMLFAGKPKSLYNRY